METVLKVLQYKFHSIEQNLKWIILNGDKVMKEYV